jgi:hypothetical protein
MFIKLESESKANNSATATNRNVPPVSTATDKSFNDLYLQQILKSSVTPVINDQGSNADDSSSGSYSPMMADPLATNMQYQQLLAQQKMKASSATNSTAPTSATSNLDVNSSFGIMLGKKIAYFENNIRKEGVVKQVALDKNKDPYFQLEDGATVRLEKVIPDNEE